MAMGQEVCATFSDQSPLPLHCWWLVWGPLAPCLHSSHFESPSLTTQP